jgi:signal transduction histidine kinase
VRFRIRHRDRSWRIFEAAGRNLLHDPAIAGIVVNSRDITERVAAEDALRRSEAALQRRRAELRALAAGLLTAQEQERSRISRELHDDLNQRLAMLAVDIQGLEAQPATPPESIRQQLHSLHDRIAALSDDVRRMAYDLHPSILEHLGLTATLQSHCREFAKREGIRVLFRRRRVPAAIPQETAVCLYRIAQESLRNVARHSGAERATVTLTGTVEGIRLSARDNGAGFDLQKAKRKGRLGMVSMEERARLANGTISVKSAPGEGTEVVFFVPLPRGKP